MTELPGVKTEPSDEFDDALSCLASAAIARDSMPLTERQQQPPISLPRVQQQQAANRKVQQYPLTTPKHQPQPPVSAATIKRESKSATSYLTSNGTASPVAAAATGDAVGEEQWCDVGVVRTTSCVVSDFYFTERPIDHSADTADYLPDYTNLRKLSLLPGVAYKFRVAALNACGIGEWSDVSAFKTCLPGYPGAPCSIRISKSNEGASLRWDAPSLRYGKITEYSVCLAIEKEASSGNAVARSASLKDLPFVRVYCGTENNAFVENSSLKAAFIDRTVKPAIIFRIAARNEKGYGPATQVRWLQDFPGAESTTKEAKKRHHSEL